MHIYNNISARWSIRNTYMIYNFILTVYDNTGIFICVCACVCLPLQSHVLILFRFAQLHFLVIDL